MPSPARPQPASPSRIDDADGPLTDRSDQELVALLRQGRHGAFEMLATRYQARLLRFCWKILHSKEDAEDALQDVLAAAFRALVADDREIEIRPWLYRIARNRCINELRRARRVRVDLLDDQHDDNARTLVEKLANRQRFRELVADVQALPETQRTALLLREIDGFAYQQIATAMGTTVPGVKSLLVRARAGLRHSSLARDTGFASPRRPATRERRPATASRGARTISYQSARAAARVAT